MRYGYANGDMHLIRKNQLCKKMSTSRNGLDCIAKNDPSFPRPIKCGTSRQSPIFYVVEEVDEWLEAKMAQRKEV